MRFWLTAFPALLVPLVLYALGAMFWSGGEGGYNAALDRAALSVSMPAGPWELSWGELFVLAGLIALFIDLLKATGTTAATVTNHAFSIGVFVLCLIFFLLAPSFVTSPFFMLMAMALLDVIAGFTITTIGARRDVAFDGDR